MKLLASISGMLLLCAATAVAEPPASDSVTQVIPGSKARYGVDNFKVVMPGTLYRGGGTGPRAPLPGAPLRALCDDGFVTAVYAYGKDWQGGPQTVTCSKGQLTYERKRWDQPAEQREVLQQLYKIIQDGKGAMYVHCWYGMHASGFIVTTALMQFCGLSSAQAVDYWNSNVPKKIQYPKVQAMIRAFKPDPALSISAEQQARVCPKGL